MKKLEKDRAIALRLQGYSLNQIVSELGVSKSSVSIWVRKVELSESQIKHLKEKGHYREVVELRRISRLKNEETRRAATIRSAQKTVPKISKQQLWLIGTMLYWAEGGKTQRMVRFSNGDPEMIRIMMAYFKMVCAVPDNKFKGYIHIHPHLDHKRAEKYWSGISGIPLNQFYKTYKKPNKSSQSKKDSLPYGTLDIYILSAELFYKITGWAQGIFSSY